MVSVLVDVLVKVCRGTEEVISFQSQAVTNCLQVTKAPKFGRPNPEPAKIVKTAPKVAYSCLTLSRNRFRRSDNFGSLLALLTDSSDSRA